MEKETNVAKLRNQLTPLYGLNDMVLANKNGNLDSIIKFSAKQAKKNKKNIIKLLKLIETELTKDGR